MSNKVIQVAYTPITTLTTNSRKSVRVFCQIQCTWKLHYLNKRYISCELGSPFKFHVDSLANGYVTAYGPGLIYGVCGEPGNFSISTKDVGPGGLSLSIEGPGKATISCHDNKDGTISVSYLPTDPGEYKIGVIFGGKHIRGSPFSAKITGTCGSIYFTRIFKTYFRLYINFYRTTRSCRLLIKIELFRRISTFEKLSVPSLNK